MTRKVGDVIIVDGKKCIITKLVDHQSLEYTRDAIDTTLNRHQRRIQDKFRKQRGISVPQTTGTLTAAGIVNNG